MKNELRNVISSLGNTPMSEPELRELLKEKDIFEIVEDIWSLKCDGLNPTDYTNKEMEEFFEKLYNKVFGFKDDKGILKVIPQTENIKPLDFFQGAKVKTYQKKMAKLAMELNDLRADLYDESKADATLKKVAKINKSREELSKELEAIYLSEIECDDLSFWEKQLISQTREMLMVNPMGTKQGKSGKS